MFIASVGQLVHIIASDELNVQTEEQVFSAVISWVKYNVTDRRHKSQVLQHVRLPVFSPKFLVRSDDACRDLVDEAKNYYLLCKVQQPDPENKLEGEKYYLLLEDGVQAMQLPVLKDLIPIS